MNEIYLIENLYELLIFAYEIFSFSRGNGYFESILQEKAQKKTASQIQIWGPLVEYYSWSNCCNELRSPLSDSGQATTKKRQP